MDWILEHRDLILTFVIGTLIPGYIAWKRGTLNEFFAKQLEPKLDKAEKSTVGAQAAAAGLAGILARTVVNAGLSSKKKAPKGLAKVTKILLPLLLGAVLLGGCAAADAGKATTSVTIDLGAAKIDGSAVVTITATITPTSTSSGQTPTNTVSPPVNVSGVPHP